MRQLKIGRLPALDYACSEALNTLCTNLSYCGREVRSILFTSRYEQEGKSGIAMNVMRTLAGYGKRVLLVDADPQGDPRWRVSIALPTPSAKTPDWRSTSPVCANCRTWFTARTCRARLFFPPGTRC